jgi:hypothetical protein
MARVRNKPELAKWLVLGIAGLLLLAIMLLVVFWASGPGTTARFYAAAGQAQCREGVTDTDMTVTDVGDTATLGAVNWTTTNAIGNIPANTPVRVSDYCLTDADAKASGNTITDRLVEVYCCSGSEAGSDANCIWKARVVDCTSEADACGPDTGVNADCKCQGGKCTASPTST